MPTGKVATAGRSKDPPRRDHCPASLGLTLLLTALLAACAVSPDAEIVPVRTASESYAAPPISSIWPISPQYYRTTSADIYLGNLDARIETLERRVAEGFTDRGEVLAAQRYHRCKLRGRLDDAERAIALLAGLERAVGNVQLADALVAQAKEGYEGLLRRRPGAYAQHAAEFFIEIGDPERAYALAKDDAGTRQDIGSQILLATTAFAANLSEVACEARTRALATGFQPPELNELVPLEHICATAAAKATDRR